MPRKEKEDKLAAVTNAAVLIGVVAFLIMFSPLNNLAGNLVQETGPSLTYNPTNIPVGETFLSQCYDSDATSVLESIKSQTYVKGLVQAKGSTYYDECPTEGGNFVFENICIKIQGDEMPDRKHLECPKGMICEKGRCR
jgi:hypothetical protein